MNQEDSEQNEVVGMKKGVEGVVVVHGFCTSTIYLEIRAVFVYSSYFVAMKTAKMDARKF